MTPTASRTAPPPRAAPDGLPRLLAGYRPDGAVALDEHLATYGPPPRPGHHRGRLIAAIEASGLRGRGGASFPTGRKLRTVAEQRGRRVVLVNGCEGEALSHKDRLLLSAVPHLVLDGAELAAEAVGADEVVVAADRSARPALSAVARAVEARGAVGLDPIRIRLVGVPTRYVAGEETALVQFVNGGVAKPTFTPPRPFERGVDGRPTLVQNVETLAHVALIARYGPDWFRSLGTHDEPGSALLTIGGAVTRGGVCEVSIGTPLRDAVHAAGDVDAGVSAFLLGGYYGSWVSAAEAWDVPLSNAALRTVGASLGTGVVYAFPSGCCGLLATARVTEYLAGETAGQCGPCVHGLRAVADAMTSIAAGHDVPAMLDRLEAVSSQVLGRGACHYPDGVIRFVATALRAFDDEVRRHAAGQGCAGEPPVLPIPRSDGSWR
jgi:NADH:ubiquinone oxidoreductase subunit F (NADH-binding)